MANKDEFTRTLKVAEKAFGQMRQYDLPASPRVYEFWFSYLSESNGALHKAVFDVLRQKQRFDAEDIDAFYTKHFTPSQCGEHLGEASIRLFRETATAERVVDTCTEASNDFATRLWEVQEGLEDASVNGGLKEMISSQIAVVDRQIAIGQDRRRQLEEQLQKIAEIRDELKDLFAEGLKDATTDLYNRAYFEKVMRRTAAGVDPNASSYALLFAEIDHFDTFCDAHGRAIGDQVLRSIAVTLANSLREHDVVCRYDDATFAIILQDMTPAIIVTVAEKLRQAIAGKVLVGQSKSRITISIGASLGDETGRPIGVIERADTCLQTALGKGGDRAVCSPSETHPVERIKLVRRSA
ncbi:MAG: GGDEF domain-containing protein [Pseudomonadota bacterium]